MTQKKYPTLPFNEQPRVLIRTLEGNKSALRRKQAKIVQHDAEVTASTHVSADVAVSTMLDILNPIGLQPWRLKLSSSASSQVRESMVTVTPEVARSILEQLNPINRNISPLDVKRLVSDIQGGKWNPDLPDNTLVFGDDGYLKNGQHRLEACIKSGLPITIRVEIGHPPEIIAKLDQGRVRNSAQQATILGRDKREIKDYAPIKTLWRIDNELTNYQMPNDYVFELIDNVYPSRILEDVPRVLVEGKQLIHPVRASLLYLSLHFPKETKQFTDEIRTLMFSVRNGGPQRLYKHRPSTASPKDKDEYEGEWNAIFRTFHAFNLFLAGSTRERLRPNASAVCATKMLVASRRGTTYVCRAGGPFDVAKVNTRRKGKR